MALRLGLIGAGRWGKIYLKTLQARSDIDLVAVNSNNPETSSLVPIDCELYNDWRALLRHPGLEGVIVATPPSTHIPILKAAIENRISAVVEKPLTLDLSEINEVQKLLDKTSCVVLVNYIHLFHPAFVELKRQIETKSDPVVSIHSEGAAWGPFRSDYSSLWDYAPHDLSLCLSLLESMPVSTKSSIAKVHLLEGGQRGSTYEIELLFTPNINCQIRVSNISSAKVRRLEVTTTNGTYILDDLAENKLISVNQTGRKIINVSQDRPLDAMLSVFCNALKGKDDPRLGLNFSLQITQILSECSRAVTAH